MANEEAFHITNPNNCYSLFLGFARSPVNFHAADGSGASARARAASASPPPLWQRPRCARSPCELLGRRRLLRRGLRSPFTAAQTTTFLLSFPPLPRPPGYDFMAESVIKVDGINHQVAARMASAFTTWRQYDAPRQALMKAQLQRVLAAPGLSENVFEIVSKSLE